MTSLGLFHGYGQVNHKWVTRNNGVRKCVYRSTTVGHGWWLRTNAGIPWPVLLPSNEPSSVPHPRGIWPSSQQLSTRPLLRAPTETNTIHIHHQIHIKNERNQAIRCNDKLRKLSNLHVFSKQFYYCSFICHKIRFM